MSSQELLNSMVDAILAMEEEKLEELVKKALEDGLEAEVILTDGLTRGLREMGREIFSRRTFYSPYDDGSRNGSEIDKVY